MFEAEALALAELARAGGPRVPEVVWVGGLDGDAVLLLEFIELKPVAKGAARALGEALAVMHSVSASRFGWCADNFIGATPQPNTPDEDWPEFFRARRIGFQLELAAQAGFAGALVDRGERLLDVIDKLLADHRPIPSLVHGDLWAGNAASDARGAPVVFDPAAYYGDRETDLAMTELFGGFGPDFRRAYEANWPLDRGYPVRRTLYNLYHVLNHLNLFGEGYLPQATQSIDWLLSEAGA
jgi:fructosamine-3-kinase